MPPEKTEYPGAVPRDATREEVQNLVHEIDDIPLAAWILAFTGAAAQLARFGITVVWQNYLQNARTDNKQLPGALGLGQATATTIQNAFLLFQYLTPLPFAIASDAWLGRYITMLVCLGLLITGYLVLLVTSLPMVLSYGSGLGGLIAAMILTGLGQGGLSAVMYPFIGDQIADTHPKLKRNKKGDLVVTDRKLTVQYVFNGYYWMVNIASLSSIPTTLLEKYIDFWAAYLLPICILVITVLPVIFWNRRLVKPPPQGNALLHSVRVLVIACRSRFRLSEADPENQLRNHNRNVPWTTTFVNEMRRGLKACRVIVCFVIFWLCYNQMSNNIISQAGQMESHGISNDTIQALNPIACIILGPLIQGIFPLLRRRRISCGPIIRMTVSFLFIAAGMAYATGLQHLIYSRGPCYNYPTECSTVEGSDSSGVAEPNDVNVWLQTPLHFILAVGEILGLVSLNEYTYTEAPNNTKSAVQALQQLAAAIGSAFGIALGPVSKNPWLVIMFGSLSATMLTSAALFWIAFRKSDALYEAADSETDTSAKRDISENVAFRDTQ